MDLAYNDKLAKNNYGVKYLLVRVDQAYNDKLAKSNNGVMHLLVRPDVSDRTVDAKGMKIKFSKDKVRAFLTMITEKNRPGKSGLTREQNLLDSLRNFARLKQDSFTLQWVILRLHLLNVQNGPWRLYRTVTWKIMATSTFTNCLNSSLAWTSQKNCSIGLIPKNITNSDFLSILYSNPLQEYRKPKLKIGDRVRISKCDLPFRKGYEPQNTQEIFEIVANSSRKPLTYAIKDEQDEIIRGNFHQKE